MDVVRGHDDFKGQFAVPQFPAKFVINDGVLDLVLASCLSLDWLAFTRAYLRICWCGGH
jgi:hypothetical protein